jgi:hypothetical protein
MYNSSTAFEQETTAEHYKKPEQSCRVIWDGQPQESVLVWTNRRLGSKTEYDVGRADKYIGNMISNSYKETVSGLGVDIIEKLDAVAKMKAYRKMKDAQVSEPTPVEAAV